MTATRPLIGPANGDPQIGNLETPINSSGFSRAFINNLPAYRKGLSPLVRGLEVGLAHGYFVIGPWVELGPLRDSDAAALGGLVSGIALILLASACLGAHGLVSYKGDEPSDSLHSSRGWSEFTGGFFVGGMGGAFVAYFLLTNFDGIDAIFRGLVN
ncbi:photosystem I reaction center protein subunit XI [Trichothermofontia sp.]